MSAFRPRRLVGRDDETADLTKLVESRPMIGPFAESDYYEMHVDGLTPSLV